MPSRPLTRPNLPLTKTSKVTTAATATRKRPVTTLTSETNPNTFKLTKPPTSKPITLLTNVDAGSVQRKQTVTGVAKRPKAAPYDYKTKFNYVKEDYDKLKIEYRDLKEKHCSVADQNEELLMETESLRIELESIKIHFKSTCEELYKIKCEREALIDTTLNLQTEIDKLHVDLEAATSQLNLKSIRLEVVEDEFDGINYLFNSINIQK